MKKIILLILIGLFPTVMFANNFLFKRNDRNLISSLNNLIELRYINNRDIQNYDSNLQDIIIFLSDYFTSSDDKKAVRLINYLKRLGILDNYIDGLSNQNDIKDKVLYSFEFFLKKSPNIFEKDFFKEKISAFYNLMYRYRNSYEENSAVAKNLYIDIDQNGLYYDTDIENAYVKIYPITRFNTETKKYEAIDYSESDLYSYSGEYLNHLYGYIFGEVISGLYLIEIRVDNKKYVEEIFIPIKDECFIDILILD